MIVKFIRNLMNSSYVDKCDIYHIDEIAQQMY